MDLLGSVASGWVTTGRPQGAAVGWFALAAAPHRIAWARSVDHVMHAAGLTAGPRVAVWDRGWMGG